MYAIIQTGGKQLRVQAGDVVDVELLDLEPAAQFEFDQVLAVGDGADIKVGTPLVAAKVSAEVVENRRGPKLTVFKKKRRKGYKRLQGHRQDYSRVRIIDIQGAE